MDPIARAVQASLESSLGQPLIVENIAGAATVIAGNEVLKSPADGQTMFMIANSFAANVTLRPGRTGTWPRAFAPLVQIAIVPHVLVTPPDGPKTWEEFLQRLKDKGRPMTYGSPGIGTSPHLGSEHLIRLVGGTAVHAPYNGTSQLLLDLTSGRIDFALSNLPDIIQFVAEKRLNAIAVSAAQRAPELPNVQTFAEVGVPKVLSDSWFGIVVRRDVPQPVRDTLEKAWLDALARSDVRKLLGDLGYTILARPGAEFEKVIDRYIATYATIIKEAGITVQQ